jgi:REP element-mobilizing transposase RayT
MDEYDSLSHSKWECKYHVVFIPKCRRRTLYEQLRPHLGEVFRRLAEQKESRIGGCPKFCVNGFWFHIFSVAASARRTR